jgi:hypothetical protein
MRHINIFLNLQVSEANGKVKPYVGQLSASDRLELWKGTYKYSNWALQNHSFNTEEWKTLEVRFVKIHTAFLRFFPKIHAASILP